MGVPERKKDSIAKDKPYTITEFIGELKAKGLRTSISEGESLCIIHQEKKFFAIPFSDSHRLKDVGNKDVMVALDNFSKKPRWELRLT